MYVGGGCHPQPNFENSIRLRKKWIPFHAFGVYAGVIVCTCSHMAAIKCLLQCNVIDDEEGEPPRMQVRLVLYLFAFVAICIQCYAKPRCPMKCGTEACDATGRDVYTIEYS